MRLSWSLLNELQPQSHNTSTQLARKHSLFHFYLFFGCHIHQLSHVPSFLSLCYHHHGTSSLWRKGLFETHEGEEERNALQLQVNETSQDFIFSLFFSFPFFSSALSSSYSSSSFFLFFFVKFFSYCGTHRVFYFGVCVCVCVFL